MFHQFPIKETEIPALPETFNNLFAGISMLINSIYVQIASQILLKGSPISGGAYMTQYKYLYIGVIWPFKVFVIFPNMCKMSYGQMDVQ